MPICTTVLYQERMMSLLMLRHIPCTGGNFCGLHIWVETYFQISYRIILTHAKKTICACET